MNIDKSKLKRDYENNPLKRGEYPESEDIKYLFIDCCLSRSETAQICCCAEEKVKIVCRKYKIQKSKEQKNELRKRTILNKYGVENVSQLNDIKLTKEQTCLKNHGVTNGAKSKQGKENSKKTCLKKYGKEYFFQTDVFKRKNEQTLLDKYNVTNIMKIFNESFDDITEEQYAQISFMKKHIAQSFEIMVKHINETKRQNKTFKQSKIEKKLYELLKQKFPLTINGYDKHPIYNFVCDYYIPELDLLIEYNGTWTHGKHPFNPHDEKDIIQLMKMLKQAESSEYYANAVHTWTIRDVKKQQIAKENNLNYLMFYSEKQFMEWYNNLCEILE